MTKKIDIVAGNYTFAFIFHMNYSMFDERTLIEVCDKLSQMPLANPTVYLEVYRSGYPKAACVSNKDLLMGLQRMSIYEDMLKQNMKSSGWSLAAQLFDVMEHELQHIIHEQQSKMTQLYKEKETSLSKVLSDHEESKVSLKKELYFYARMFSMWIEIQAVAEGIAQYQSFMRRRPAHTKEPAFNQPYTAAHQLKQDIDNFFASSYLALENNQAEQIKNNLQKIETSINKCAPLIGVPAIYWLCKERYTMLQLMQKQPRQIFKEYKKLCAHHNQIPLIGYDRDCIINLKDIYNKIQMLKRKYK